MLHYVKAGLVNAWAVVPRPYQLIAQVLAKGALCGRFRRSQLNEYDLGCKKGFQLNLNFELSISWQHRPKPKGDVCSFQEVHFVVES